MRYKLHLLIVCLLSLALLLTAGHSLCCGWYAGGGCHKGMPRASGPLHPRGGLLLLVGHVHLLHEAAKGLPVIATSKVSHKSRICQYAK